MAYAFPYSITIDHTKCGGSDSTDFPVLFSGVYDGTGGEPDLRTVANGGDVQNTVSLGGATVPADLVFATNTSGSSLLKWEIDYYDPVTGTIVAWFKQPTLTHSTDAVAYIVYGDSGVTTWQGDINATWNSNIQRVYHLADGSTIIGTNSTSTTSTLGTAASLTAVAGKIDGGVNKPTNNADSLSTNAVTGLPTSGAFTISCWLKTTATANSVVWSWGGSSGGFAEVYIDINGPAAGKIAIGDQSAYAAVTSANTYNDGNWHYVVGTYSGSGGTHASVIYVDGASAGTSTTTLTLNGTPTQIRAFGLCNDTGSSFQFVGDLDELRIYSVELSADWITAEYNNQNSPSTFYTLALASNDINLNPSAGAIALTGGTPTAVLFGGSISLAPPTGTITITGGTPTINIINLAPGPGLITITGGTPISNFISFHPGPGTIALNGSTPGVSLVRTFGTGDVLYIDNVAYEWKEESAAQIQKTLSSAWSATFNLRWFGGTKPLPGTEVAFFWQSTKRFGGTVLSTTETAYRGNFAESTLTIQCTGYQSYMDRTVVAKLYTIPLGGIAPIIIFDLWYEHLQQFGISINYPQGEITAGTGIQLFHYITVTEAFNRLKSFQPGWDYYISDNKELIWVDTNTGTSAPFTLRNNDRNVDTMSVEVDNGRFRNSQWVLPAIDVSALKTESSTASAGQTAFTTQYPLAITPIIAVNSVRQNVTQLSAWNGAPWYYIPGDIGVFRTPGAPALSGGDTIDISYPNPFPIGFNVLDQASINAVGLYEAVFQAKDATTEIECLAIAAGLLEIYGTNGAYPQRLNFSYNSQQQAAWLVPGMALDVIRTFPTATGTYIVEQVSSTLDKLSVWRHAVTARMDLGDVTDAQALQAFRTSGRIWVNVPPVRVTIELDLTGVGNITGLQPQFYPFMGQGIIASWDMQFGPGFQPTGEDFIMDLLYNGVSIFPPGDANKIVVPEGSTQQASGIAFSGINLEYTNAAVLTMNIIQAAGTAYGIGHLNLKPNTALLQTL